MINAANSHLTAFYLGLKYSLQATFYSAFECVSEYVRSEHCSVSTVMCHEHFPVQSVLKEYLFLVIKSRTFPQAVVWLFHVIFTQLWYTYLYNLCGLGLALRIHTVMIFFFHYLGMKMWIWYCLIAASVSRRCWEPVMSSTLDGKNLVLRSSLLLVTPVCPPVSTLNLLAVERKNWCWFLPRRFSVLPLLPPCGLIASRLQWWGYRLLIAVKPLRASCVLSPAASWQHSNKLLAIQLPCTQRGSPSLWSLSSQPSCHSGQPNMNLC